MTFPGTQGAWTLGGTLGDGLSYGCDVVDGDYPNTSCIELSATLPLGFRALTPGECTQPGAPCAGYDPGDLDMIYWQQNGHNEWQANSIPGNLPVTASHLDWGDNLESVSWSTGSIVRVETTPFQTTTASLRGFQMWHVYEQGPDELWGVRATVVTDPETLVESIVPYVYSSPYAIIHDATAHLLLSKLPISAPCPAAGPVVTGFLGSWDPVTTTWKAADYNVGPILYTSELNIGGKIVYGYNWNVRRMTEVPVEAKAGWWRLTFFTTDNKVVFDSAVITSPPVLDPAVPALLAVTPAAEEGGDTGPLYAPVIDDDNNLTFIDICLTGSRGGGSGGGGRGQRP